MEVKERSDLKRFDFLEAYSVQAPSQLQTTRFVCMYIQPGAIMSGQVHTYRTFSSYIKKCSVSLLLKWDMTCYSSGTYQEMREDGSQNRELRKNCETVETVDGELTECLYQYGF